MIQHRWMVLAVVSVALAVGTCAGDTGGAEPPATSPPVETRPPLDDPPDPGPIPDNDGLSDDQRSAIVAKTVRITGSACGVDVEGSGFVAAPGVIATNAHVLVGMKQPRVETVNGSGIEAVTVAFDPENDLALLRVAVTDIEPLELGDAADGTVGVLVGWEAEGEPDPTPYRIDRPVNVRIDVVASDERVERPSWLVAADVESGDSGAALVDQDGVVVGIAYATTRREAGVAYATRASELQKLLDTADLDREVELPSCT